MDVLENGVGCVRMFDDDNLVEVSQKNLQTVIPARGEKVKIVSGSNAGQTGTLIEKTEKNGDPYGVIRLDEDLDFQEFDFDSICKCVVEEDE